SAVYSISLSIFYTVVTEPSLYPLKSLYIGIDSMPSRREFSKRRNLLESLIGVKVPRSATDPRKHQVSKSKVSKPNPKSVKSKRPLVERIAAAPISKKRTLEERISRPLADRIDTMRK